jgi:DNA-directed RNA polymerase specialized sigma24 family protein
MEIDLDAVRRLTYPMSLRFRLEHEDLVQQTVMNMLLRKQRYPDFTPFVKWAASDAARELSPDILRDSKTNKYKRVFVRPLEDWEDFALVPYREDPDEDEVIEEQLKEWRSLGLRERQERIMESHRALGTSYV